MKGENYQSQLLRKYLLNECSEEELSRVLEYLKTAEGRDALSEIIDLNTYSPGNSEVDMDPKRSAKMLAYIQGEISKPRLTEEAEKAGILKILSPHILKYAAIFLGLMVCTGIFILFLNQKTEAYSSGYGQTRKVVLPDGSIVTLNGNSTVKYKSGMADEEIREVWLEGEAFFSVRHTATNQKFIVNTADGFNVEVLGTEFNVINRESKARVVLNSGKVRLNIKRKNKSRSILMKPGELVEFKKGTHDLIKKVVNPENFSSWKNRKLIFDSTPLAEVVDILKETYGYRVQISDKSLLEKKIWGSLPSDNVQVFLTVLSKSFNLSIKQSENLILIEENPISK